MQRILSIFALKRPHKMNRGAVGHFVEPEELVLLFRRLERSAEEEDQGQREGDYELLIVA